MTYGAFVLMVTLLFQVPIADNHAGNSIHIENSCRSSVVEVIQR